MFFESDVKIAYCWKSVQKECGFHERLTSEPYQYYVKEGTTLRYCEDKNNLQNGMGEIIRTEEPRKPYRLLVKFPPNP